MRNVHLHLAQQPGIGMRCLTLDMRTAGSISL